MLNEKNRPNGDFIHIDELLLSTIKMGRDKTEIRNIYSASEMKDFSKSMRSELLSLGCITNFSCTITCTAYKFLLRKKKRSASALV